MYSISFTSIKRTIVWSVSEYTDTKTIKQLFCECKTEQTKKRFLLLLNLFYENRMHNKASGVDGFLPEQHDPE